MQVANKRDLTILLFAVAAGGTQQPTPGVVIPNLLGGSAMAFARDLVETRGCLYWF